MTKEIEKRGKENDGKNGQQCNVLLRDTIPKKTDKRDKKYRLDQN